MRDHAAPNVRTDDGGPASPDGSRCTCLHLQEADHTGEDTACTLCDCPSFYSLELWATPPADDEALEWLRRDIQLATASGIAGVTSTARRYQAQGLLLARYDNAVAALAELQAKAYEAHQVKSRPGYWYQALGAIHKLATTALEVTT